MSDVDLVKRLRLAYRTDGLFVHADAADAIERLTWERDVQKETVKYLLKLEKEWIEENKQLAEDWKKEFFRAEAAERKVEKLREAIEAHGMLPNGFCVCSKDRDGEKSNHQPECRDLRAALAETENANDLHNA